MYTIKYLTPRFSTVYKRVRFDYECEAAIQRLMEKGYTVLEYWYTEEE